MNRAAAGHHLALYTPNSPFGARGAWLCILKLGSKPMRGSLKGSQMNPETHFLHLKLACGKPLDVVEAFSIHESQNCARLVNRQSMDALVEVSTDEPV